MDLSQVEELFYGGRLEELLDLPTEDPIISSFRLMAATTSGKMELAATLFKQYQSFTDHENILVVLVFYCAGVDFLLRARKLQEANEFLQKILNKSHHLDKKDRDQERYFGRIIRLHGTFMAYSGDFKEATIKFTNAIKIQRKLGDRYELPRVLSNRAATLYWLGDLEKALADALEAYNMLSDDQAATESLIGITNNTGLILVSLNQPQKALMYFEESLINSTKIGNQVFQALNYHNIVKAHTIMNNLIQARYNLDKFEKYNLDHPMISLMYRVTKGMVYVKSSRFQDLAEGQKILNEVIEEDIIDHQFTIMALFTAMDYLLIELEKFSNEATLIDINDLLSRIDEIATTKAIRPALIQGNMIRSRLDLMNGDVIAAKNRLEYAKNIALETGQQSMVAYIEDELEDISRNEDIWSQPKPETPLSVKLATTDLSNLIQDIKNNQILAKYSAVETPLFLIIMNTSGLPLFTNKFAEQTQSVNEFLISGFLTAVDVFGKETFNTESYAEKLQFQGNLILMRKIGEIVYAYAYTTDARSVIKRFDNFVDYIQTVISLQNYVSSSPVLAKNNLPAGIIHELQVAVDHILLPANLDYFNENIL